MTTADLAAENLRLQEANDRYVAHIINQLEAVTVLRRQLQSAVKSLRQIASLQNEQGHILFDGGCKRLAEQTLKEINA